MGRRRPAAGLAPLLAWLALSLSACAHSPASGVAPDVVVGASEDPVRDAAILAVLDRYMEGLNALDVEAHVSTYHFPHYRHAGGEIVVWSDAGEAMPILAVPREKRREALRAALGPDWDRSEWVRREVVQADEEKVHVATTFVRLRADGSAIAFFDSLYVLTLEAGEDGAPRWGIKGRSSFAP